MDFDVIETNLVTFCFSDNDKFKEYTNIGLLIGFYLQRKCLNNLLTRHEFIEF